MSSRRSSWSRCDPEPRLRGGHQPGGRAAGPRPICSRSTRTPPSPKARSTPCSRCSRRIPRWRSSGPRLRAPRRLPRSRRQALLPDAAERARPLHRSRPAPGRERAGSRPTARPRSSPGPVDAVNGAFMLMRRSAFEAAGGFDEGYWMYMEDLDLSYRARAGGLAELVRAGRDGPARQGRDRRRPAAAAAQLALPPRHVPLLPAALRAAALARRSTRLSTSGSR